MSDEMVTLATFSNPIEAELARSRLEGAGIPAFLLGNLGGGMFAGMSNLFGEIRLTVAAEHAEEAARVLEAEDDDDYDEDEGSTALKGERRRKASSTEVRAPVESPMQDRAPPPDPPPPDSPDLAPEEEMPPEEDDERDEPSVTWKADDVATRAFLRRDPRLLYCWHTQCVRPLARDPTSLGRGRTESGRLRARPSRRSLLPSCPARCSSSSVWACWPDWSSRCCASAVNFPAPAGSRGDQR